MSKSEHFTNATGAPVPDNTNILTAGRRGPALLQDIWLIEKLAHFDREAIVAAYPRSENFKEDIIQAFHDGFTHKPETTFGTVNADVLADKDPQFQRINFCSVIRGSRWKG